MNQPRGSNRDVWPSVGNANSRSKFPCGRAVLPTESDEASIGLRNATNELPAWRWIDMRRRSTLSRLMLFVVGGGLGWSDMASRRRSSEYA
ncbi:hypothetical protein L211DRAFT_836707 [Terfezia boudieri ATCC MYA-4762]|uniref:Uncharacterized protein n=1 Tax=Terfezia boudieri ATCC MYA-4762 TaxID=1051890 RepID=A0A3N4LUX7_9PEZI|nr:hypothetical protein L211DRAFT_836707 [Terfezia boudieri ATCC MYA-4762]